MQFGTQGLDAPPPAISHILYVSRYKGGPVAMPCKYLGSGLAHCNKKERERGNGGHFINLGGHYIFQPELPTLITRGK
jgi:hypothetical protein